MGELAPGWGTCDGGGHAAGSSRSDNSWMWPEVVLRLRSLARRKIVSSANVQPLRSRCYAEPPTIALPAVRGDYVCIVSPLAALDGG
jgi:hypothetical protein